MNSTTEENKNLNEENGTATGIVTGCSKKKKKHLLVRSDLAALQVVVLGACHRILSALWTVTPLTGSRFLLGFDGFCSVARQHFHPGLAALAHRLASSFRLLACFHVFGQSVSKDVIDVRLNGAEHGRWAITLLRFAIDNQELGEVPLDGIGGEATEAFLQVHEKRMSRVTIDIHLAHDGKSHIVSLAQISLDFGCGQVLALIADVLKLVAWKGQNLESSRLVLDIYVLQVLALAVC